MNEYFRNQRSLFTSSRSKIPYLQKEVPKAETYRNVRRIEKSEEKSHKKGSQKVFEFWDTSSIYRGRNAEKTSKKHMGENPKKKEIWIRVSWFFRSETVQYFDHISLLKILIKLKFWQLKGNLILYNVSRKILVRILSSTRPKAPQNVNLKSVTWLARFWSVFQLDCIWTNFRVIFMINLVPKW